jgi:hypothetical protein
MGPACEQSINAGVERALGLGKIVQSDDYCGEHRATRPGLASAILHGGEKQALLHIHSSAKSGKQRVSSVQALCRVSLTSRILQSIVRSHATATIGSSFLEAIAAVGFLLCTEQLPVAQSQFRTFDRVHPYSAGGARWTRKSRHDLWTGEKRSTEPADCYLCARRAVVGAALA